MYYDVPKEKPEPKRIAKIFPWELNSRKPTRIFADETIISPSFPVPVTSMSQPTTVHSAFSSVSLPPGSRGLWQTYTLSNAWDEIPEINRFIESIQKPRRGFVQVISGQEGKSESDYRPSTKITDFPTEIERPSLPVTPAPVRRSSFSWVETTEGSGQLPSAEGVPNQEDWVGFTTDVFLHLLLALYSYWKITESTGPVRKASAATS
jgi:glycogenin glucosyltransferase